MINEKADLHGAGLYAARHSRGFLVQRGREGSRRPQDGRRRVFIAPSINLSAEAFVASNRLFYAGMGSGIL